MPTPVKEVRAKLAEIEEGGILATENLSLTISRDPENGTYDYRMANKPQETLAQEKVEKRLSNWKPERFAKISRYTADDLMDLIDEGNGKGAAVREQLNPPKKATANGEKRSTTKRKKAKENLPKKPPRPVSLWSMELLSLDGETVEEVIVDRKPLTDFEGRMEGYHALEMEYRTKYRETKIIRSTNHGTGREFIYKPRKKSLKKMKEDIATDQAIEPAHKAAQSA